MAWRLRKAWKHTKGRCEEHDIQIRSELLAIGIEHPDPGEYEAGQCDKDDLEYCLQHQDRQVGKVGVRRVRRQLVALRKDVESGHVGEGWGTYGIVS